MPMHVQTIRKLWRSGFVRRWHSNDAWELRESGEINGGHTQRVAILYMGLFPEDNYQEQLGNLKTAILHDAGELLVGDISAPAKAKYPDLRFADREAGQDFFRSCNPRMNNYSEKSDKISMCDLLDAIMYAFYRAPRLRERDDWKNDVETCLKMARRLFVLTEVEKLIEESVT